MVQAPNPRFATSLATIFEDRAFGPLSRIAITTAQQVLLEDVLAGLRLQDRCVGPDAPMLCTAWFDNVPMQFGQPLYGYNGMGLVLHIRPPAPAIPAALETDGTSMLQSFKFLRKRPTHGLVAHTHGLSPYPEVPSCGLDMPAEESNSRERTSFQFNPHATSFDPNRPSIRTQNEVVQDLHALWEQHAFAWENEARAMPILTFFVDHRQPHVRCDHGRPLHLYDDFWHWEQQLLRTWTDQVTFEHQHEFHIVSPQPPLLQPFYACSVIVVQAPSEELVSSLITVLEGNQQLHLQMRSAVTTSEHIRLPDVLERLVLHHRCLGRQPTHGCQAWYDRIPLQPQGYIPGRSGYSIVLQVRPRPPPNVALSDHDGPVLLQLSQLLFAPEPDPAVEVPDEDVLDQPTVPVRLQSGHDDLRVPSFVEIRENGSVDDVQCELRSWGLNCKALRFGHHDRYLCLPTGHVFPSGNFYYMFSNDDCLDHEGCFLHTQAMSLTKIGMMKVLERLGYPRAVITSQQNHPSVLTANLPLYLINHHTVNVQNGQPFKFRSGLMRHSTMSTTT